MKRKIKVISYYFFYHQLNITPSKYCLIKSKKSCFAMLREEPDRRKGEMSSCNTFMGVTYSLISLN